MKTYPIAKADMAKKQIKSQQQKPRLEGIQEISLCPTCEKDFATGIKAAYKLGLLDGRNKLNHTINLLHKVNRNLYDELLRLDNDEPTHVNSVILSREEIDSLIRTLKKADKKYQARKLEKLKVMQIGESGTAGAKLREMLETINIEK